MSSGGSSGAYHPSQPSISSGNSTQKSFTPPSGGGFNAVGLWVDIETIAYTIIAVLFLIGLRRWYLPSALFNIFNLGIWFLSGVTAIPGITMGAFGSHLSLISSSLTNNVLMISWFGVLVLSLLLLRYDPGSELDRMPGIRR